MWVGAWVPLGCPGPQTGVGRADGALRCISSCLGPLSYIWSLWLEWGRAPKGCKAGAGVAEGVLKDSGRWPLLADLAVLQCLPHPVVSVRMVTPKVLPQERPQLAPTAICAGMPADSKQVPVVSLLSLNFFCTNESDEVKESCGTQPGVTEPRVGLSASPVLPPLVPRFISPGSHPRLPELGLCRPGLPRAPPATAAHTSSRDWDTPRRNPFFDLCNYSCSIFLRGFSSPLLEVLNFCTLSSVLRV